MSCTHCATPVSDEATFCSNCRKPLESASQKSAKLDSVAQELRARYEVLSQIGKGAFGEVYKARDVILNRTVAIKRIRLDWLGHGHQAEDVQRRFIREAQIAAQLQHPNIVTVYDVVSTAKASYIVMEFVDGTTLAAKLSNKKPLSLSESLYILSRVARALHHAHEHKVVHRDVKPANILVSRKGEVKVGDFGVAKVDSSGDSTRAGVILGTPHYMSPEQARGGSVDGRSDLFSLGCIFYECLTGQPPFNARSITGVLIRIVNDEPAPVETAARGLPGEVQGIVHRALAKDLAKRYSTADELARALESIPGASTRGIPVVAEAPSESGGSVEDRGSDGAAPDSVADSLMRDARRTTRIHPHLRALKEETRKLRLMGSPLLQFRNVSLTTEEAYILSRVQESVLPRDILSVSPLGEEETARALLGFLRTGLVAFVEEPEAPGTKVIDPAAEKTASVVERDEVERLYRQLLESDDWEVLGLKPGSSSQEVKKAFQSQAFRFHPDRYAAIDEPGFQEKVSWLFQRVSWAFASLTVATAKGTES